MNHETNFNRLRNIAIGAAILVLGAYAMNFGRFAISNKPSDWGVFGDYVGGALNPILAFLNLLLTYYIAQMVNDFTTRENNKQALMQNRLIKSQLAFDALKEFQYDIEQQFKKILDPTINGSMVIYYLDQAVSIVNSFHTRYDHLFTENPMFHSRLISALNDAIKEIGDRETIAQNFSSHARPFNRETVLKNASDSKDGMISNLNRELVRRLDDNVNVV